MAKIKPFKAFVYNQEKLRDVSRLVCPPYDIISPAEQNYYHNLNPHNFIHILLGRDIAGENKYHRAANYLKDWLDEKVLIHDEKPAVYFYSQQYSLRGEKKTRLGFISLLHLGEKDSSCFGHEHTRLEPKEDRLRLLREVKANLSPIFAIFLDKKRIVQRLYQQYIQGQKPFIDITDNEKNNHKLWRMDSPDVLAMVEAGMQNENIFIADGHHRYEVACMYRDEMRLKAGAARGQEEGFNYILTYFTNTDPRGLAILPIHRLLRLSSGLDFNSFKLKLKDFFDIEEIKEKTRFFFLMKKGGCSEHLLGMYKDKKYFLLRLKNIKILDKIIGDKPKVYRSVDAAILNTIVFNKILGLPLEDKENLKFSPDANELIKEADSNPLCAVFFLNPAKIEQIISVALNGERMPPKSTYFYPKVLSGLVINKLE